MEIKAATGTKIQYFMARALTKAPAAPTGPFEGYAGEFQHADPTKVASKDCATGGTAVGRLPHALAPTRLQRISNLVRGTRHRA